jgi:hypothetical protein
VWLLSCLGSLPRDPRNEDDKRRNSAQHLGNTPFRLEQRLRAEVGVGAFATTHACMRADGGGAPGEEEQESTTPSSNSRLAAGGGELGAGHDVPLTRRCPGLPPHEVAPTRLQKCVACIEPATQRACMLRKGLAL